jgi:predicted dehydrogenase
MEKMKVGFIGCGGFASGNHIPNTESNPNLEIQAFCDLNENILDELRAKYKPSYVTSDMEKIFLDPEVRMVICSTKPDFRLPIMKLAVKHKKHLFVEKPLCYKEDEVGEMVSLMKDAPIKFMVGFNRPFSPLMRALKLVYDKYKKGSATIIYRIIGEAQLWPTHHYDAVVINRESTIIHEATHIFNVLNWLTGLVPERVYTAGEGNMDNIITLAYPENITAVIISGDNSTAGYPKERIEVNTNYGTIVGDHFTELLVAGFDNFYSRKTFDYKIGKETLNTDGRRAEDELREWRKSITKEEIATGYYYERQVKVDKGHYNEIEFFRRCILENTKSEVSVMAGAVANLTAWRAIESWEKRTPIELDFSYLSEL